MTGAVVWAFEWVIPRIVSRKGRSVVWPLEPPEGLVYVSEVAALGVGLVGLVEVEVVNMIPWGRPREEALLNPMIQGRITV